MTDRIFFKTTIHIDVLSEDTPLEFDDLGDINDAITEGDCSGQITFSKTQKLTGKQAAKALQKQGSEPEFFRLTADGKDIDTDDPVEM